MAIDLHPALDSIRQIITSELDADTAAAVFAEIAVEEAGDDFPADDPARWVWSQAWKRLAALAPDRFAVSPTGIGLITGYQLAFLYGLKNEPESVRPVELSAAEQQALDEGRALLYEWTGIRSLRRPGLHYQWDEGSVALSVTEEFDLYARIGGASFDTVKRMRRMALYALAALNEVRAEEHPDALVGAAILHEEIHAAINVTAGRNRYFHRILPKTINEAATQLTDLTIYRTLVLGTPPSRDEMISWLGEAVKKDGSRAYGRIAPGALLEALPANLEARDWTRCALTLAIDMARTPADEDALSLLNRRTRHRWTERTWRRKLALDSYWS